MSDLELQREILRQILEAIDRIERRFEGIQSAGDFLAGDEGIDKLDGIAMMLIWIGENIKALEKVGGQDLLKAYPDVDWKGAKGTRDILSHHYGDIDTEVIFYICQRYLPSIKIAIQSIMKLLAAS
ncbi:MAG: DUF86 domain-containing protein [Spirulina sp.]